MQNLEQPLGRDNHRRLLLTLNGWAVAQANEESGFVAFAEFATELGGCELFVTFGQR